MTTQGDDVQAVLRSQEYFRLKQVVGSAGAIYEIDDSAKSVYIGPDSDIAEVQLTYFNPQAPSGLGLETATIAVNGPFVGRIDALLATRVPSTGQPARILVSPVDIVDNAYVSPNTIAYRQYNLPALIDVMFSLRDLPEVPAVRADRTFRLPSVPYEVGRVYPPDDGSTDILVPIYGRRMVTVTVVNTEAAQISFSLVTLQPGVNTQPRGLGSLGLIATLPSTPFTTTAVYRASDAERQGKTYDGAGAVTGAYAESDAPQDPTFSLTANPRPRGMADLLLINITDTSGDPGPATRFVDLFIKTSDKES